MVMMDIAANQQRMFSHIKIQILIVVRMQISTQISKKMRDPFLQFQLFFFSNYLGILTNAYE